MYDPEMTPMDAWTHTQAQDQCAVGPVGGRCPKLPEFWVQAGADDTWLPLCEDHGPVFRSAGLPTVAFDHLRWAASVSNADVTECELGFLASVADRIREALEEDREERL